MIVDSKIALQMNNLYLRRLLDGPY